MNDVGVIGGFKPVLKCSRKLCLKLWWVVVGGLWWGLCGWLVGVHHLVEQEAVLCEVGEEGVVKQPHGVE